jgi:hypothetical protein
MDRREAVQQLGALALAPLVPALAEARWPIGEAIHLRIGRGQQRGRALSPSQLGEVRALAETIIPRSDIPGAADVGAAEFVDLLLAEWHTADERSRLLSGLDALSARCREQHGRALAGLPSESRASFVASVDGRQGPAGSAEAAYARIKDAIVFAFLTAEPIAKLVNPLPVMPGRFDGCVTL